MTTLNLIRDLPRRLWAGKWLVALLLAMMVSQSISGPVCAALQSDVETGEAAFSNRDYPWYDVETGQVQRIELGVRPGVSSSDRDGVALAPINTPPVVTNRTTTSWAGWFEGISLLVWMAIGSILAILVAVLVWMFLRMESEATGEQKKSTGRSMAESIKQLPFELENPTGDFSQLAHQAYVNGDYRKAVTYLFSHILVCLDQQSLVRLRKGKTNRQYLQELKPHPPLADYYHGVMVPFEAAFFGNHPLDKEDFERCWNDLSGFQATVAQTTQVPHV